MSITPCYYLDCTQEATADITLQHGMIEQSNTLYRFCQEHHEEALQFAHWLYELTGIPTIAAQEREEVQV